MTARTPLYEAHRAAGAKMVEFAGFQMPLHYGSQVAEHHQVRGEAGMFDVSHMAIRDLHGAGVENWLRGLLAADVATLTAPGMARYTVLLTDDGGIIDDLIVYRTRQGFRLITNAGTRPRVSAWLDEQRPGDVQMMLRDDLAMLAVQGPQAARWLAEVLGADVGLLPGPGQMPRFSAREHEGLFVARTGYTGEAGGELIVPADQAPGLWQRLLAAGVAPCGLGARDTLRLEAGLCLYGHDMDETVTPFAAGLDWTVDFGAGRDFVGRAALEPLRERPPQHRLAGIVLLESGVLRDGARVFDGDDEAGVITSGGYGPTVGRGIGLLRTRLGAGAQAMVETRGNRKPARIVQPPFVRGGRLRISLD